MARDNYSYKKYQKELAKKKKKEEKLQNKLAKKNAQVILEPGQASSESATEKKETLEISQ